MESQSGRDEQSLFPVLTPTINHIEQVNEKTNETKRETKILVTNRQKRHIKNHFMLVYKSSDEMPILNLKRIVPNSMDFKHLRVLVDFRRLICLIFPY